MYHSPGGLSTPIDTVVEKVEKVRTVAQNSALGRFGFPMMRGGLPTLPESELGLKL